MSLNKLKSELKSLADKDQQKISSKFFKTAPGQYGEGDIFLGIKVPILRQVAKQYANLSLTDCQKLLDSPVHGYRFIALVILIDKYNCADSVGQKKIFDLYLRNYDRINNWDLVDTSAPKIVGDYLLGHDRKVLYKFARSNHLWKKRIAIISTFTFIGHGQFDDTLKIAEILLYDDHDLIHKAVGWMLREVGNVNQSIEEKFLQKHYRQMPRTMLRYAIEKFSDKKRKFYLKK